MREIVLDTETTGLSHKDGHRIVEIGCIELWNCIPTGKHYHTYINPERPMSIGATQVSGITTEFLAPFPVFEKIASDFLNFIQDSTLVIHNAPFDMGFLNAELSRLNLTLLEMRNVVDTVGLARRKFPGSPANLDALCKRFQIDLSKRKKHGALLDAELLSHVYLELMGGRQRKIEIEDSKTQEEQKPALVRGFPKRKYTIVQDEEKQHEVFLASISNALWKQM
jgi:DNA polymerase-3 subunit epsilon